MDSSIIPNIVIIIMLLVLSALFSSCETAFSSVNKIRLKNYAAKGDKRAEKALKIANKFEDALTAILIGNNIVNILSCLDAIFKNFSLKELKLKLLFSSNN